MSIISEENLPEVAFSDSGENPDHWIHPIIGISGVIDKREHLGAVGHESAAKEEVSEVDVAHHYHKGKQLADEKPAINKRKE